MNLDILRQMQSALMRVDQLLQSAVKHARSTGSDPTDALRGLIVTDEDVDRLLNRTPLAGFWDEGTTHPGHQPTESLPLARLANLFELSPLDVDILLLALAPELDRRYERIYGYLQDDVSLRRMTVNLAMNLLGGTLEQRFEVWGRLTPAAPLRVHHIVESGMDNSRPNSAMLANSLRVDPRIVNYLLDESTPDERVKRAVSFIGVMRGEYPESVLPQDQFDVLCAALGSERIPLIFFDGPEEFGKRQTALALCAQMRLPLMRIDASALTSPESLASLTQLFRIALREAYLSESAVVVTGWEHCIDEHENVKAEIWDALLNFPLPVFISASKPWEPRDHFRSRRLLRATFPTPDFPQRSAYWTKSLQINGADLHPDDIEELASKYRFSRDQMARVVQTALDHAHSHGRDITLDDLYAGAHAHSSLRLGHLAKRVEPRYGWDDLILPPDQVSQLHEMTDRARTAYRVHEEWGFGKKVAPNIGISALFAGESGTGKTMSAEVLAYELGLVMYQIDLSAVVSKYIGETEKNLSVIFAEAQSSNAILFFDEADALFGKRSEVKDAHDRYANIETAYLLQQIDAYDGIAIMATNLRQNLDEAFTRRLDFVVDFPFPDVEYRWKLWKAHFPDEAPLARDINLNELAERYRLSGGNIRNAALASAYLAAADGGTITMAHIRQAVRREHQKMGRLLETFN